MERASGQFIRFDSVQGSRSTAAPASGVKDQFTPFSEALARQLAPRNLLEQVLADRIVLSAWTMQTIAEREIETIRNPRAQGLEPGDVSPQGVALVTECLERTLELFYRLRGMAPVRDSQPAPATTAISSDFESRSDLDSDFDSDSDFDPNSDIDFDSDPDTVFDLDSELVDDHLADLSNEWPVVPRGRSVEDQADGDTGDQDRSTGAEEPLARRWEGRLGFDRNVSEDSPVVKGTWVTVSQIVSLIVDGWSWTDILRAHPELTEEDIRTCLAYTLAEEGDL